MTWRNKKWTKISSYDLKPGDLIIVEPGYQHVKCPYETISDQDYLTKALPFTGVIPKGLTKINQK